MEAVGTASSNLLQPWLSAEKSQKRQTAGNHSAALPLPNGYNDLFEQPADTPPEVGGPPTSLASNSTTALYLCCVLGQPPPSLRCDRAQFYHSYFGSASAAKLLLSDVVGQRLNPVRSARHLSASRSSGCSAKFFAQLLRRFGRSTPSFQLRRFFFWLCAILCSAGDSGA